MTCPSLRAREGGAEGLRSHSPGSGPASESGFQSTASATARPGQPWDFRVPWSRCPQACGCSRGGYPRGSWRGPLPAGLGPNKRLQHGAVDLSSDSWRSSLSSAFFLQDGRTDSMRWGSPQSPGRAGAGPAQKSAPARPNSVCAPAARAARKEGSALHRRPSHLERSK